MYKNAKIVGCGERTLVLSHGYGGSQAIWDKVVPYLSQRNQVLLFDWDFSGAAEAEAEAVEHSFAKFADDLIALMDEMKLSGGAVYVGHSMSSMIGCIASVKRPGLFSHLVLLCASPRYLNSEDYEGGFVRADIENMLSDIAVNFHSWAKGFIPLAVGADDPNSVELFGKSFLAMNPKVAHDVARMIFLSDQREVLDKVEVPCTIVQVSDDFAAPPCVGQYMLSKMRCNATMETIESVGHFPQLVAPKKLLDILDSVLLHSEASTEQKDVKLADQMEINGDIDIAT